MPCGCKKGHGVTLHGAGVRRKRRKRGGMAIGGAGVRLTGAGYKKRRKGRRKRAKRAKGGGLVGISLLNPLASLASMVARNKRFRSTRGTRKGGGGRFISGAVWHGYGKGSGMSVSGAGLYGKRLLGRGGAGRRQI